MTNSNVEPSAQKTGKGDGAGLPKQMGESDYAAPARLLRIIENYE